MLPTIYETEIDRNLSARLDLPACLSAKSRCFPNESDLRSKEATNDEEVKRCSEGECKPREKPSSISITVCPSFGDNVGIDAQVAQKRADRDNNE